MSQEEATCILQARYQEPADDVGVVYDYFTDTMFFTAQAASFGIRSANFYHRGRGVVAIEVSGDCNEARDVVVRYMEKLATGVNNSKVAKGIRSTNGQWREISPEEYAWMRPD